MPQKTPGARRNVRRSARRNAPFLGALLSLLCLSSAWAQQRVIPCTPQSNGTLGSTSCTDVTTANPLPVNATISASATPLAYATSGSSSVGTTSGTLAAAGAYTKALQICTLPASTTNVWLNVKGGAAVVSAGVPVWAAGGCVAFGGTLPIPTTAITAITDGGTSQTVTLAGG